MAALDLLSLNTATVRDAWTLEQCIEGCQRHGVTAIAPWRDRLQEMGVERAARAIRGAGLDVSGLCRGGMFPAQEAQGRRAAVDDNLRAIDEAASIGAACLVMVCGGLPAGSRDLPQARDMVRDGLASILDHARAAGVRIALEPLHPMTCADRSVLSTLGQALDLCDELGPGLGVAIDVYHVWWDPQVSAQIARAGDRIFAFHTCDWRVPTRDLVFDRAMPGDGVIDIAALRHQVQAAGYAGRLEMEILSTDWWARDPNEVLAICKARHEAFC
ncbi:endonuclease [Caulobacter sp. Root1455]|uniref:sugar phosphate isomerase/epimerase family protein n=1 Tax=unclassified Caulobacter TaxID=2648921 RepID=UPI0006F530DA|nr:MULTISPECIES: sugar phosphate isomerase/epimerase family protein [unclassified Caulobacter]KQY32968.1 endonuclease [Caulobacter sp. Root487D2Y]KQZ02643.1 endonuclease [Caulobacter sp. Root1455]